MGKVRVAVAGAGLIGQAHIRAARQSPTVELAAIVVWQVADTARAVFAVEAYPAFVATQAESALRHVAVTHPYDGDDGEGMSVVSERECWLIDRERLGLVF